MVEKVNGSNQFMVTFILSETCVDKISSFAHVTCQTTSLTLCFHSQWIIGEMACYTYSMVAVPLYDTLGPEALVFIIDRGNWESLYSSTICASLMVLM